MGSWQSAVNWGVRLDCRLPTADCSAVEDAGDVGVVHQRQGLPLRLEAGDDLAGVHARFNELERNLAPHRLLLLGDEDQPHAPFADLLHELVGADDGARALGDRLIKGGPLGRGRLFHEVRRVLVSQEQLLDPLAQAGVPRTGAVQKRAPFRWIALQDRNEKRLLVHGLDPLA